jgi:hypothetical protein
MHRAGVLDLGAVPHEPRLDRHVRVRVVSLRRLPMSGMAMVGVMFALRAFHHGSVGHDMRAALLVVVVAVVAVVVVRGRR